VALISNSLQKDLERPTAADTVGVPTAPPATAQDLIPQVSALRYRADLVNKDVATLGRDVYALSLEERSTDRERQGIQTLLDDLADRGIAWSSIATMLGVSVPAVRKWRQGEGASPESRQAAARLAALVDMLSDQFMIEDPAAWLEMPLAATRRTLVDVLAQGRVDLILEYAAGWISTPQALLDQIDPKWRESSRPRFETFVDAEGQLGIRRAGK
jgi:transcriptional regulator with XRE-family HTH domain